MRFRVSVWFEVQHLHTLGTLVFKPHHIRELCDRAQILLSLPIDLAHDPARQNNWQKGNARNICPEITTQTLSVCQTKVDPLPRLTHCILCIFVEFDFPSEIQMTSLARALTNVSVDNCKARQKLDSIQKPKRRNREGGDKNFSTPEEEETGGGRVEGGMQRV